MPLSGTYMSETVYHEDGYGNVTERIVVATTYDNLFMTKATYLSTLTLTDVLSIGNSKKDVNFETGVYAQDELTITMHEARIESAVDLACYQLVLQCQDIRYPLYIAYFIEPDDTSTATLTASSEFVGIISPNMKAKEVFWRNKSEYDPDTQALYEWSMTAKSFDLSSFNSDLLSDLVDEMYISGDDFTGQLWRELNVADRLGWCILENGDKTKFANLVNLNRAITELSRIFASRLSTNLGTTFSIDFDECTLDISYSPARWWNQTNLNYRGGDGFGITTRFVGRPDEAINRAGTSLELIKDFAYHDYVINDNDAVTLKFGDNVTDAQSPWISSHMFFYQVDNAGLDPADGTPQTDGANSFLEDDKITFAEWLIALASSFGLIASFSYSTPTNLHIKFMSRAEFTKEFLFVPDVVESDISVNANKKDDNNTFYGLSCKHADEGQNKFYIDDNGLDWKKPGNIVPVKMQNHKGKKIYLTISPTTRHMKFVDPHDAMDPDSWTNWMYNLEGYEGRIPHNGIICNGEIRQHDSNFGDDMYNAVGLHTAIYVKTVGVEVDQVVPVYNWLVQRNYGLDGIAIWSPAGAGHYKHNGINKTVYKQADYVNELNVLNQNAYSTERNLTIPYLCRFRKAQDGSHADDNGGRGRWQNCVLGSKITFGTGGTAVTYIVIGIDRDSNNKSTKLKLWNISNFAFSTSTGLTTSFNDESSNALQSIEKSNCFDGIASGTIGQYNIVVWNDDLTYSKATPSSANINRFCGIAMNDAINGGNVTVLKPGNTFFDNTANYAVRTPLYCRVLVIGSGNISSDILQEASGTEDVHLLIGYGTGTMIETINFDNIDNQIILES